MTDLRPVWKLLPAGALALLLMAGPASASTISWISWSSGTTSSSAGSAAGTISAPAVTVSYSGEMGGLSSYVLWSPTSTFEGGTVGNAPPSGTNAAIDLVGGGTVTDTLSFSSPVANPVLAIWSLGDASSMAEFAFTPSEPFSIEGGGPSAQFSGSSIFSGGLCPANAVCGKEGNGVIQFHGTFSQLTWTNPVYEGYYAFTAGAPVPEPSSLALLLVGGLGMLGASARRRSSGSEDQPS